MKNRNIILLFLSIILAGCTEIIEVELDDTYTNLAVEGSITNRLKMQSVKISKTSNYFSNIPLNFSQATTINIHFFNFWYFFIEKIKFYCHKAIPET